jgi:hypothetical protein
LYRRGHSVTFVGQKLLVFGGQETRDTSGKSYPEGYIRQIRRRHRRSLKIVRTRRSSTRVQTQSSPGLEIIPSSNGAGAGADVSAGAGAAGGVATAGGSIAMATASPRVNNTKGSAKGRLLNDVLVLDVLRFRWYQPSVHGCSPQVRKGHSARSMGGAIFVSGGFQATGDRISDQDAHELRILT